MRYQVRFVSGDALPEGVRWAFARQAGTTYLFVVDSAIDATTGRCEALTEAWTAWQEADRQDVLRGLRSFAGAH